MMRKKLQTIFNDFHKANNIDIHVAEFSTHTDLICIQMTGVVSNFIMQALFNDDITLFGDGSQTRSFVL